MCLSLCGIFLNKLALPLPSKSVNVYVGKWMIPPSYFPTQADNVLSPKNLSVDGV